MTLAQVLLMLVYVWLAAAVFAGIAWGICIYIAIKTFKEARHDELGSPTDS
jgi:hypothetical protein